MTDLERFIAEREAHSVPDSEIDTSEIPELTESDFARGHFKNLEHGRKSITFRIDLDNLAWLQSGGAEGYQAKLNDVIRWARENSCPVLQK